MGKGKKKDKKKDGVGDQKEEELPAISSLTLTETQPSTSTEQTATETQPSTSTKQTAVEKEEECVGLGLDLGGGKKRKPRKKKESTPPTVQATVQPQAETQSQAATEPQAQPQTQLGPRAKAKPSSAPSQEYYNQPPSMGHKPSSAMELSTHPPQGGIPPSFGSTSVEGQQPPPGWQQVQQPPPGRQQGQQAPPGWQQGQQPPPGWQQAQQPPPGWQQGQQPPPGWQQGQHPPPGWQQGQQLPPGWQQGQQPPPGRQQGQQPPPGWQQGQGRGRGVQPPVQPQRPGQSSQPPRPVQPSQFPKQERKPQPPQVACSRVPEKILGCSVPSQSRKVLVNYLAMNIKGLIIHRYDVTFTPDKPKKFIPYAFLKAKAQQFSNHLIAFDQMKNCYALKPLPGVVQNDRLAVNVEIPDNNGRMVPFEVSFKGTGTVDLSTILNYMKNKGSSLSPPTEAIQCIDVILRQGTLELYVKAGRQFFKRPKEPIDLGDGLEMWTGLFQSAIFTDRAFINVDVAHKGFPRAQPLVDAWERDFRLDPNKPIERQRGFGVENFISYLKGLRVMAMIGGDSSADGIKREFICNELVKPPREQMFTMTENGREVRTSVEKYLAGKGIRLRYPNLNCLWVGPRDKHIYYPLELLTVSYGQARNKQLNDRQLSTMVKEAATPPNIRKKKIEEVISNMKYSTNRDFKAFGLDIGNEFVTVDAKVLDPPTLEVGAGLKTVPRKGAWNAVKLLKPEALQSWGFIAIELDPRASNSDMVINQLKSEGSRLGMRVSDPVLVAHNVRMQELQSRLLMCWEKQIRFLVIIVPTRYKDCYHKVKQLAETEVGILTQCIKEFTASRKMNGQTAKNILLKVNSKLMGINQALDVRSMPKCLAAGDVMVVGADVTHPSPDQSTVPSIAAVTASIDPKCFKFNIQLSIQTPKKEMIVEFEDMMVEHLQIYRDSQKKLPRKIFVFRDGVSEGQFAEVMNSEMQAVTRAYQRLCPGGKPEVLFLLVQKRHHTRLFVPNSNENVEPGTVVDTVIVHAKELDFYLVSHQAIKGTARPTRYHAVCNDGGIPHDEVEQLTYYLCHLFSRCMRSVSYPTPTYYAHLACLRARSLTHGIRYDNQELERRPQRLRVMDRILEISRMFFV